MPSKNPRLVVVLGLVWLGLLAKTMAQSSRQGPIDEDGVTLGFDAPPISVDNSHPSTDGNGRLPGSYYGSAAARRPATAGAAPPVNDGRYVNTQEASIIGPAPPRYQSVSSRAGDLQWAGQGGPALGLADGQPLRPASDATSGGPPRTRTAPQEVNANPPTTVDKTSILAEADTTGKRKLATWITMGLFASLAANLFFGWVAWETHAKYQDLVDDMSENDGRQRWQDPRTRGDHATVKEAPSKTKGPRDQLVEWK